MAILNRLFYEVGACVSMILSLGCAAFPGKPVPSAWFSPASKLRQRKQHVCFLANLYLSSRWFEAEIQQE
jgi:hypothetical protein